MAQGTGLDRAESLAEARRAVLPSLPAAREASQALPAEPLSRQARTLGIPYPPLSPTSCPACQPRARPPRRRPLSPSAKRAPWTSPATDVTELRTLEVLPTARSALQQPTAAPRAAFQSRCRRHCWRPVRR